MTTVYYHQGSYTSNTYTPVTININGARFKKSTISGIDLDSFEKDAIAGIPGTKLAVKYQISYAVTKRLRNAYISPEKIKKTCCKPGVKYNVSLPIIDLSSSD